jgi:HK97 family phage major capsid protein
MDIKELRQKRASLVVKAREIINEVEKRENPEMTQEDQNKYDAIMKDIDKLGDQIKTEERLRELERVEVEQRKTETTKTDLENKEVETKQLDPRETPEYRAFFEKFLTQRVSSEEARALQVDSDIAGGYIVAPLQFVNQLIKEKDNMVAMRRLATQYSVPNAESLGAPALDNDPADPTWTSELSIGSADSTMTFGKRELKPHPLAQYILVSNTLLRKAVMGAENLVRGRLAYKGAVVEENAYLNGSGALQPLGVFTASDDGISTSRDVSTGNTTTEIRTDGLLEALYSLKAQYRNGNCEWIFHRDAVKQIRKLKDGEGRYIWQVGIVAREPDTILGYPVNESEYAPNTFTTGLYVGILGDFSYYWIADALNMTIQKLVELGAATNQVYFISRSESDGMPVLESAFARVKLG